jgi:hypothetical protein
MDRPTDYNGALYSGLTGFYVGDVRELFEWLYRRSRESSVSKPKQTTSQSPNPPPPECPAWSWAVLTVTLTDWLELPPSPVQLKVNVLVFEIGPTDSLPAVALVPLQSPLAVQLEVLFVADHVRFTCWAGGD